jgi:heme-degrading monooxygenase HmoA
MIERHWIGVARADAASAYVAHLETETFPGLERLPGFRGARILRRGASDGVEFRIVTVWESLDAIRAFAGSSLASAVVPPAVQAMMIHYDPLVTHYEIARSYEARGRPPSRPERHPRTLA